MLNRYEVIGFTGKAAEIRYTGSGKPVATFSVATTKKWKDQDGNKREHTEWVTVVAWSRLAEICGEYLSDKGKLVYVSGENRTREYEAKDGTKRRVTELVAEDVRFLFFGSEKRDAPDHSAPMGGGGAVEVPMGDDDIPFVADLDPRAGAMLAGFTF